MAGLSVHVINLQMIIISMFMNGDDGSVLDRQVLQSLFAAVATQLWELYFNPIIACLRPISSPFPLIFPQS